MNGFLNILKPAGISSAAVVGKIRRITGEKRVGHAGTLDPEAAGVLPVMLGKATRLFDYLVDKEKAYTAVVAFGTSTDTQDATGQVLETGENWPDLQTVYEQSRGLIGDIVQTPSMYSAIKVNGKPLYAYARQGKTLAVPERTVHIDAIDVLREMPDHGVEISVRCGKGTYIRSVCDDLGKRCGCPAHMRSLLRTKSGAFTLDTAILPERAEELAAAGSLRAFLLPLDFPLQHLGRLDVPPALAKEVRNGVRIPASRLDTGAAEGVPLRVYLNDDFWGIAKLQENCLYWCAQMAPEEPERKETCGY